MIDMNNFDNITLHYDSASTQTTLIVVANWQFFCGCEAWICTDTGEFWIDPFTCYKHAAGEY